MRKRLKLELENLLGNTNFLLIYFCFIIPSLLILIPALLSLILNSLI